MTGHLEALDLGLMIELYFVTCAYCDNNLAVILVQISTQVLFVELINTIQSVDRTSSSRVYVTTVCVCYGHDQPADIAKCRRSPNLPVSRLSKLTNNQYSNCSSGL